MTLMLSTAPSTPSSTAANSQQAENSRVNSSLLTMLLLAMLGGMILNLMPCVFPVLSLKALSFTRDDDHDHRLHGLIYTAGVIISFVIVAAVLMSLKAAGEAVGWGFHLQSPWFVAALAYLFFVLGLGLSGLLEIGGGLMGTGSTLANRSGYGGSFFTGVLATVVASPCTAPFMGTALGFAVTQPLPIALSVFAALGLGMALPLLALSCSPSLIQRIPKPGPWMETVKQFLAFPLYATALWLCWVVGKQVGVNAMALVLLGCLLLALAIWLWSDTLVKRCSSALFAAVALSILTSSWINNGHSGETNASDWQAYSPDTLAAIRAKGEPVFINITADWCITCLANERVVLSTQAVKSALKQSGIHYLKGDWTNYDPQITALLERYGRTGIPLYLFFPRGSNATAQILPQILNSGDLLDTFAEKDQ